MSIDRHGLSVGIERLESEFFLSLKAIGKLTHADYETIPPIWRSHKMQLLTATILFLFITSSAYAESFGDYIGAEYVRNYDGDTITFNLREFHPAKSHCQLKLNNASRHFNNIFFKIQVLHSLSEFSEMAIPTYSS